MNRIDSDMLVIGGGGAGMSAALAAPKGSGVTIVDDNPEFGGQIWRRSVRSRNENAERILGDLDNKAVRVLAGSTVFDAINSNTLAAVTPDGRIELGYQRLVIATGARERFIPFPGWTLPNVFGAGGLQALVKGGFPVAGKRIIVGGTGPLLLAVAEFLVSKGAQVLFVAEQVSYLDLAIFAARLFRFPSKLAEAARLRIKRRAVALRTNTIIAEAAGRVKVESVTIVSNGKRTTFDCDILAVGYHLVPNMEIPLVLGLDCDSTGCAVDEFQRTSVENVFAAGETTGIGGLEMSLLEGEIAGLAAGGCEREAKALFASKRKYAAFARILNETYELRDHISKIPSDDTTVCRCEDVAYGALKEFECWRDAKLQTRCGMGPCQGRVCGPAAGFLFGWDPNPVRPPILPVKLKDLV